MNLTRRSATLAFLLGALAQGISAQTPADELRMRELFATPTWRSVGPAATTGRIVDIEVHPDDPWHMWVAAASGGIFETVNNGITWEPIFERAGSLSIGDMAVAPSNPDVIWVGTGEANNQRSSYWGDGVYVSRDAGKTWRNVGLRDTHHVGRIIVHPKDPDTVWVAAAGHLYSSNRQRGVFKTSDGGKTWKHVLHPSDEVGVIDLAMHPKKPQVLYAASYERLRRAWDFDGAGPGSGLWRSRDGGETWDRLAGGLPEGELGRIGVAVWAGDPNVVWATIENANERPAGEGDEGEERRRRREVIDDEEADERLPGLESYAARPIGGEVYRSDDGGDTWSKTNERPVGGSPGYYYGQIEVDPNDVNKLYVLSVPVWVSTDGGKTWKDDGAPRIHVDHHALWIDPRDSSHLVLGCDGGLNISYDGGKHWELRSNLPIAQFYDITVDTRDPYRIYGGTQDNGTWGGPSVNNSLSGVKNTDWYSVGGGDGMHVVVDPTDPDRVYCESQFGALTRVHLDTGERRRIQPRGGRGDRTRYNWNSPIALSPHNPKIVYFGGNVLFRSLDGGDRFEAISGDLTTADEAKIAGNVPHCTITTISESPRRPGVIWVGSDDGLVHVTADGGVNWTNVTTAVPGVPANTWVSRVVASQHDAETAYVTFTGYRDDDFRPFVFRTRDLGATWDPIVSNLPAGSVNVLVEDPTNEDLLFIGTEYGIHGTLDGGLNWYPMERGMPRVAVYDLELQTRDQDLVAGTHGRGAYVVHVGPLCALTREAREQEAFLAPIAKQTLRSGFSSMQDGFSGHGDYAVANPENEAWVAVHLATAREDVTLRVVDESGDEQRAFPLEARAGVQLFAWDLRRAAPQREEGEEEGPFQARRGAALRPGNYLMILEAKDAFRHVRRVVIERSTDRSIRPVDPNEEAAGRRL